MSPMAPIASSPATAATPDDRQAEYFMRLLTQSRQGLTADRCPPRRRSLPPKPVAASDDVRRHRQMTLTAEQDRRTVADLIDNLRRRFQVSQRVRPVR